MTAAAVHQESRRATTSIDFARGANRPTRCTLSTDSPTSPSNCVIVAGDQNLMCP